MPQVHAEARKVKEAALPASEAGLKKLTVPELKAHLSGRDLQTSGRKAELVARLLVVVDASA